MTKVWQFVWGGLLRGQRVRTLGLATSVAAVIDALGHWAVGDLSILSLLRVLMEQWPLIAAGIGLATVEAEIAPASQVTRAAEPTISQIADRALRR